MRSKSYTFKQFLKHCPQEIENHYTDKSNIIRKEDDELVDLVAWFKFNYPQHCNSILHPANESMATHGGHRKNLAQKGMLKGAPDIMIMIPKGGYGFATFELKRGDHQSSVGQEQIDIALANILNGGYSCICWGLDAAKCSISNYMSK